MDENYCAQNNYHHKTLKTSRKAMGINTTGGTGATRQGAVTNDNLEKEGKLSDDYA